MQQVVSFVRGHFLHALLVIPGAVVITLLHESAHALAVVLQGGSVTEFQWLPSAAGWGHIRFTFPATATYSPTLISLAPHLLSLAFVFVAVAVAWRRPRLTDRAASFVYFWLFFVPVVDMGFALLVWMAGSDNDLAKAFGPPGAGSVVGVVVFGLAAGLLGYVVQARLYDQLRLGWLAYGALVLATLLALGGLLIVV